jgi:sucrose-6-phosphate hydrolase SacC (GH32 family)
MDLVNLQVEASSSVQLTTTLNTTGQGGFVFDYYSSTDYKFVTFDAKTGKLLIGHVTSSGTYIDASYTTNSTIKSGTDFTLGITLQGSTVSVSFNGQQLLTTSYNALLTDGGFGLFSVAGATSFDVFRIQVAPK